MRRGGTYQASLDPLASITCERIGTLPPVLSVSCRASERRENEVQRFFQQAKHGEEPTTGHYTAKRQFLWPPRSGPDPSSTDRSPSSPPGRASIITGSAA